MKKESVKRAINGIFARDVDVTERTVLKFQSVLKDLTDAEERMVRLYFGLDDEEPRTLEEIANKFMSDVEYVRETLSKSFKKMCHPTRTRILFDETIEEIEAPRYTLSTKLGETNLSVRTQNCLMRAGVFTLEDLIKVTIVDLIKTQNLGKKSFNEIIDFLWAHGELR